MKAQYPIRVQAIHSRGREARFFIAVPAALAAAIGLTKGETVQWSLTDKNTLAVKRVHQKKKPTPVKEAAAKKKQPLPFLSNDLPEGRFVSAVRKHRIQGFCG